MAGDEDPITLTQIKTRVDRLVLAVERLNQGQVRDRVDGRQRRDRTSYEEFNSNSDNYEAPSRGDDRRDRRRRDNYDAGGFKMKMDLPSFNGQLHIEEFLDWIAEVERYFEYMEIPDERKVKLVAYRLKGGASAWWESVCMNRSRQEKPKVDKWEKMKKLLKARFLPTYYYMSNRYPSADSNYDHAEIKQAQSIPKQDLGVMKRTQEATKREEPSQKHNIFRTRCTVMQKVCDVIIDSHSSKNLVSRRMVNKLDLKTEKHPPPYKIDWIHKDNNVQNDEMCRVSFSIGRNYVDEVLCDVVEMDTYHMLLGRPWQLNVGATYRSRDNAYIFKKDGRRIALMSLPEKESSMKETTDKKKFLVVDNKTLAEDLNQSEEVHALAVTGKGEPAPAEIPPKVQTLIMHEIRDVDCDMIAKMDIMHDILKEVVSDIAHIDVVPMEENDKIESETIGDVCEPLSGGPKAKEMECKRISSFEIKSVNDFDKIEMKLHAQEYKKQQENNLEEFFKSSVDPRVVSHVNMVWERFIQKFDLEEALAEEVKEQMEKINAKYKADADRCRRRKVFIDEATIQANISSGSSFFQQGETDVGRLTNNFMEEQDNHKLNTNTHMLLTSAKKRSYLLIRKADSDILYMKIAYLDETKPTRLSDFRNLISITSF